MVIKNIEFELFRYQLLPVTTHVIEDMFHEIKSTDDVRRNKNKFFWEIMSKFPKLTHRAIELNQKLILSEDPWIAFKLAAHKSLERNNENFRKEQIENWPYVTVLINNDPDIQIIAVSKNRRAFTSGGVIASLIRESLSKHLLHYQLSMHVEAIFDKSEFWNIVKQFEGKITNVRFELISPNMANISKALELDLKQLNKDTNSHKTVLELNSPEGARLEIKKTNKNINGLVEYSSEGGGDISFKISGYKKRVHTSRSVSIIDIDEITVDNLTSEKLDIFLNLIKN